MGRLRLRRERQNFNQSLKPFVQIRHAHQVLQYALIDLQRPVHQRLSATQFQQAPAPQRRDRSKGAPVRGVQDGQGEPESGKREILVPVYARTDCAENGFKFHSRGQ